MKSIVTDLTKKQVVGVVAGAFAIAIILSFLTIFAPTGETGSHPTQISGVVVNGAGNPVNSTIDLFRDGVATNSTTNSSFNFTVQDTLDIWSLGFSPKVGNDAEISFELANKPKNAEIAIETTRNRSYASSPPGELVTYVNTSGTKSIEYNWVKTSIPYNASRLAGPESSLAIWQYVNGSWKYVDTSVVSSSDVAEVTMPDTGLLALATDYVDTFDDGNASPDWTGYTASGRWNENNTEGYLVQDSKGTGVLLNKNATGGYNEYTVSARMKKSRNYSSLLLRSDGTGENAIETRINWDTNTIEIGYVKNGKYRVVESQNYSASSGFVLDTLYWYNVSAMVEGNTVQFTVSEPKAPSATVTATSKKFDLQDRYTGLKGRDGGGGDKNLFDNFTVSPLLPEEVTISGFLTDTKSRSLSSAEITLIRPDGMVAERASGQNLPYNLRGRKGWKLRFNASRSHGIVAEFGLNKSAGNADVVLENFSSNPVRKRPVGIPVRFAKVGATDLNYTDVKIQIRYNETEVAHIDESSLTLRHYKDGEWVNVPATVDPEKNIVTGTVSSLSNFAVTGNYEDNFSTQSGDWSDWLGTWSWTDADGDGDNELEQDSGGTGVITNDQADGGFLNYSVKVDTQMDGNDEQHYTAVLLRSNAAGDDAVEVRLDFPNDDVEIAYISGGTRTVVNSTGYTGGNLANNQYYTLNASIKRNNVTVHVDGTKQLEASSPNFDLTGNHIGLKGTEDDGGKHDSNDVNLFDNFYVTHWKKQPKDIYVTGEILDYNGNPLTTNITFINQNGTVMNTSINSTFDLQGKEGWFLDINNFQKGVEARFTLTDNSTSAQITLDNYTSNPVSTAPPGTEAIKYGEVSAQGLNYSEVRIRLHYNETNLNIPEENLYLRHYKSSWTTVPTTVNVTENYVEGTVSSLSPFAVTGTSNPGDPAIFTNRNSSKVAPSYSTNYTLTITNNDDETDTIDLNSTIDNSTWSYSLTQSSVQLGAGESTDVTLKVTVPSNADYGTSANITVVANSSRSAGRQTYYQTTVTNFDDQNATHSGTEAVQSGGGMPTRYSDGFEDGTLSPWTSAGTGVAGVNTDTSNTGTYSMYTGEGTVNVTSEITDLSPYTTAMFTAWINQGDGTNDPESGEDLEVYYNTSSGTWSKVKTYSGADGQGTTYNLDVTLPSDALHSGFRIRFRQTGGSGGGTDYWYVDDVTVNASESGAEGEVTLLDYSDKFDDGTISGDWDIGTGWSETDDGGDADTELQANADGVTTASNVNATGDSDILTGVDDFNASVDINMAGDDEEWTAVMLRSDGGRNGVEIRLNDTSESLEIGYLEDGARTQLGAAQLGGGGDVTSDTWYNLNISIRGDTVWAYVYDNGDGETAELTVTNDNFTYPYTNVDLRGDEDGGGRFDTDDVNYFDNFRVWTKEGTYTSPSIDTVLNDPVYNASSLWFNTTVPTGASMNVTVNASPDASFGDGDDVSKQFDFTTTGNHTGLATKWMDGNRYVRIKANLSTDDPSNKPRLHDWGFTREPGTPSDNVTVETIAAEPEYNVTVSIDPGDADVPPGGSNDFTVKVKNNGTLPDTYSLNESATGDDQYFTSSLSSGSTASLGPGATASLALQMTADPGTPYGTNLTSTVTGTSDGNGSKTDTASAIGHVRKPYPRILRVVTNRYAVLDDPNSGNPSGSFESVPDPWGGTDYWSGESTTIRPYAMVHDQYGEPLENQTVRFVVEDWAGNERLNTTNKTNHAGIANASLDTNAINYWGFWKVEVKAPNSTHTATNSTVFVKNWWGCANCHGDEGDPATATTNPSYQRSPYIEGYEGTGHTMSENEIGGGMWQYCMEEAVNDERCTYCHQGYGGSDPAGDDSTGGQYPWGAMRGDVKCMDCHTGDGTGTWLGADGGDDGNGLPKMPSCFNGQCHNLVNPVVNPWRTTTVTNNQSQYSRVWVSGGSQPVGAPLKAHSVYEDGGDVPCIMCHGPMHNITTPYPAGQGNDVTEKEQCYQCHIEVKHPFFEGVESPQPCTDCHTMNIHNISGSLRYRDRTKAADYDANRNIGFVDDPAWGLWQRWELAYNESYDASADPYREESVDKTTCESCHVGSNQKRGVHNINLTYSVTDNEYFGWNGTGLDCLGCHNSNLNGSGTGQGIHSAHPAAYDGNRVSCSCHDDTLGSIPQSSVSSGMYTVDVFNRSWTYDASEPQMCEQCHGDWHRNPLFNETRYPTVSQGLNETLQQSSSTNVSDGSYMGPKTPITSNVSPGIDSFSNCTQAPCHLDTAHEAMNPAVSGSRFPNYDPWETPGCDECHALNKWDSHMEAVTDLYGNYQDSISIRSACDSCHFEPRRDEGFKTTIVEKFP